VGRRSQFPDLVLEHLPPKNYLVLGREARIATLLQATATGRDRRLRFSSGGGSVKLSGVLVSKVTCSIG
jgi:hypothetical protein